MSTRRSGRADGSGSGSGSPSAEAASAGAGSGTSGRPAPEPLTQEVLKRHLEDRTLHVFVTQLPAGSADRAAIGMVVAQVSKLLKDGDAFELAGDVFVGGSHKKGTGIFGDADADIVVPLHNYWPQRAKGAMEAAHRLLVDTYGGQYRCNGVSTKHINFILHLPGTHRPVEVDLLPIPSKLARERHGVAALQEGDTPDVAGSARLPPPPYAPEIAQEQVKSFNSRVADLASAIQRMDFGGADPPSTAGAHQFVIHSILLAKWLVKSLTKYECPSCLVELFVLAEVEVWAAARRGSSAPSGAAGKGKPLGHAAYVRVFRAFLDALVRLDEFVSDATRPVAARDPTLQKWYTDPADPDAVFTDKLDSKSVGGLSKWAKNTRNMLARVDSRREHEAKFAEAERRRAERRRAEREATAAANRSDNEAKRAAKEERRRLQQATMEAASKAPA